MVGAQRERATGEIVHVHQGAVRAAGARECQQVRRDPPDPGGLVVHHLEHLAVLVLQVVQQERLGEPRNDGGGIVDLVRHAAHQLTHGRELLGLLVLRLAAFLLGDVAHQDQHAGDVAPFAHGRAQQRANPLAAVGAEERDLEALHLAPKRRGERVADQRGGLERDPGEDRLAVCSGHGPDRARRLVRFHNPARRVGEDDRVRHGVHHETQVALGGGGGAERLHQRAGLARDLVFEQRGIAAVGAQRVHDPGADDGEAAADQHGARGVGD